MTRRFFVDLPGGMVHCAECGSGPPVLLLHQTPRSWDEYRDVLPLLAESGWRAIAMDTPGYGDSAPLRSAPSIEAWAATATALADALGLARFAVVGHHTGAAIATELAAAGGPRVTAAVLSAAPYIDEGSAARRAAAPPIDRAERRADGAHLVALWQQRQPWYPPGDVDLLERFVVDALRAGPRAAEGHVVVGRYAAMPSRLAAIRCPTLVIAPTADPHAMPHARRVAGQVAGSRYVEVEGGRVPLPDQLPARFASLVATFLRDADAGHVPPERAG